MVQKRATDMKIDELRTVAREGATRQSANNEAKYLPAPPLAQSIGATQAKSVTARTRRPYQI
jgi:hypothetical protein